MSIFDFLYLLCSGVSGGSVLFIFCVFGLSACLDGFTCDLCELAAVMLLMISFTTVPVSGVAANGSAFSHLWHASPELVSSGCSAGLWMEKPSLMSTLVCVAPCFVSTFFAHLSRSLRVSFSLIPVSILVSTGCMCRAGDRFTCVGKRMNNVYLHKSFYELCDETIF